MKSKKLRALLTDSDSGAQEVCLQTENLSPTDRVLCLALDVGEHMLRCGGEIHRVEDTLERICHSYGATHVEVFAITNLIIAAVRMPDGSYSSQIRRVYKSVKDLYRLEKFNSISRRICQEKPPLNEVEAMIRAARHAKPYPDIVGFLGSILATGAFALFFGGTWRDGVAAALVGLLLELIEHFSAKSINQMARTVIRSFLLGIFSLATIRFGIGENLGYVTIGAIMLLIPGVDMSHALRDLLCGNLLSGTLRTVQSLLLAMMIAIGYAASLLVTGGLPI